jgi:hypothetical protein
MRKYCGSYLRGMLKRLQGVTGAVFRSMFLAAGILTVSSSTVPNLNFCKLGSNNIPTRIATVIVNPVIA